MLAHFSFETSNGIVDGQLYFQKDIHERLLKENACLKEKRVSPEKLEELSRYRNKVLEYSKCITALRSSAYVIFIPLIN